MDEPRRGRRRIDRVTAPDLLDGAADHPPAVLRSLRDECREEEAQLSYARRVVQGQIDIAKTELRRRSGEESDTSTLVEQLARILADAPSGAAREARTVRFYQPGDEPRRREGDVAGDLPSIAQLPDLETGAIEDLVARLETEESRLSEARRAVLGNLDALQAELVRRYREGDADVDAILSATIPRRDDDA